MMNSHILDINQQIKFNQQSKQSEIKQILSMFKSFLKISQQTFESTKRQQISFEYQDLQHRDRKVVIKLPSSQNNYLSKHALESYITQVCYVVWSRAFYYFSSNQLSYQYTKIYSSQLILQNIVRLSQKFYLSSQHFQIINTHIQNEVLVYMLNKYPMTLNTDVNRNVSYVIKQIDKSGEFINDYLYNSSIIFSYRQTGQYNDLIMQTFNQIITKIQRRIGNRSIFQKFQHKMQKLFQSITDQDWMKQKDDGKSQPQEIDSYQKLCGINSFNNMQRQSGLEETSYKKEFISAKARERQKEKYKQKVQGYTSYKIGRKLPDSTRLFSNQEISSHNIKIQNPQNLRIFLKWCEQLERKFKTPNYYQLFVENIKLQNGKSICLVLDNIKSSLDQLMSEERTRIERQISQLSRNNYYLQSELLMRQIITQGISSIQKYEKIAANYSIDIVNNLHSYTISYLNRLIHGLLTVANKFSQLPEVVHLDLPSKVNLITFQIFDLIRCQCDSGQKQIIRLYNQILKLCEGQNVKMVRVINRLKRGTHDILINIRYREVLCEVQLGVTRNKNKFIEYSNRFNHYLYQLKRSPFGPLTELGSIWRSLDQKFNVYKSIPTKSKLSCSKVSNELCQTHYSYQLCNKPFICSGCQLHFYQSYYIKSHLKCKICDYWICARCQINKSDCKSLLHAAFKNEEIIQKCTKISEKGNFLPEYGICIYIESQQIRVEPFRRIELKNNTKIFGIKNKQIYEIFDVSNDEKVINFHNQYVIFEVKSAYGKKHIKIDDQKIREYLTAQKIKKCFKQNKQKICLNYNGIYDQQLLKLIQLTPPQQRLNIKKIELMGNNIQNLTSISNNFNAVKILEVSKNKIKNFEGISQLQDLQKFYANDNNIQQFPAPIGYLQNLKELCLCQNKLQVFPDKLKLSSLKILLLSHNSIHTVPAFIHDASHLQTLSLKNNSITFIPDFIGDLISLEVLELQSNCIDTISQKLSKLQNIQFLNLSYNKIFELPQGINNLKQLNRLQIKNNQLKKLPNLHSLQKLGFLDCSNNQIQQVIGLNIPNLSYLNLGSNKISQFPTIQQKNSVLKILILNHNKIKIIQNLQMLQRLQQLYLNNNILQNIFSLQKLQNLQILYLEHNCLSNFEQIHLEKLKQLSLNDNKLEKFCLMDFSSLQQLNLSHNKINHFQGNVMPCIRKINLNSNKLHTIKLTTYPRLRYIYLSHNSLSSVPQMTDKNQIKTICLDNNRIKMLSGNLLRSQSLNHLNLAFNQIKHIPQELQKAANLHDRSLQLSRNPIQSVDCWDFVLRKGTKSTVEHLQGIKVKQKNRHSTQSI